MVIAILSIIMAIVSVFEEMNQEFFFKNVVIMANLLMTCFQNWLIVADAGDIQKYVLKPIEHDSNIHLIQFVCKWLEYQGPKRVFMRIQVFSQIYSSVICLN